MEEVVHSACLAHYHSIIKLLYPHVSQIAILINFPKIILLLLVLVVILLALHALALQIQTVFLAKGLSIIIH